MPLNKILIAIISLLIGSGLIITIMDLCKKPVSTHYSKTSLERNNVEVKPKNLGYTFNESKFVSSLKMAKIVDNVVQYSKSKSLPVDTLSVTLIDTQTNEKADYHGDLPRYPASIVKMFWLVITYQKIIQGEIKETKLLDAIENMIYKSENKAASQIIDTVTSTKSTVEKLPKDKFKTHRQRRIELSEFFKDDGYSEEINVSQKIFPINNENVGNLNGFDRQLRGENAEEPIENKLTTNDTARLMYEIVKGKSVTAEASSKMKKLLTRNIDPGFWKKQPPNPVEFNPIESFFGQGLSESKIENIVSKAGKTSRSRQEVAFIKSIDGKTQYILVVFGNDPIYGKSKNIFPEISTLVYEKMRSATFHPSHGQDISAAH
jgi:Beta-lactamase enzyme family